MIQKQKCRILKRGSGISAFSMKSFFYTLSIQIGIDTHQFVLDIFFIDTLKLLRFPSAF